MSVNAREHQFEHIELFGKPALFTNSRIIRATVPEGFHCYDLRGSDYDPGKPITVEKSVVVNHAATVLTAEPVKFQKDKDSRKISGKLNYLGEAITLAAFCERHDLTLQPDNRKFILRPAAPDEAGLFYSQMDMEKDAELATVGHLRLDFGRGDEFWTTWHPHNGDELRTPAFKTELDTVVNELRKVGPLQNLFEMQSYCYTHGGSIASGSKHHGYIAESEQYRYCLRCSPTQGDYNGYLYVYDKHQQELLMQQEQPQQGMEMGGMSQ